MQGLSLCGLTIALGLVSLSPTAEAKRDTFEMDPVPNRDGLTLGASFGRGSIDVSCGECNTAKLTEALSVSAHVGYMVTPRLALLGEHWSVRYNARGGPWFDDSAYHLVAQHISSVAAQAFLTDSIWLKAGLGVGWHITDGDYDKRRPARAPMPVSASGPSQPSSMSSRDTTGRAGFAAIGLELAHNSVFAADLQLRFGATRWADERYRVYNTALNVGFNWY